MVGRCRGSERGYLSQVCGGSAKDSCLPLTPATNTAPNAAALRRFSAFVSKGIVDDLTGYYNKQQRKFYAVVSLGREVCGELVFRFCVFHQGLILRVAMLGEGF